MMSVVCASVSMQSGYLPLNIVSSFIDVFIGLGLFYGWAGVGSLGPDERVSRMGASFFIIEVAKLLMFLVFYTWKHQQFYLFSNPFNVSTSMRKLLATLGMDLLYQWIGSCIEASQLFLLVPRLCILIFSHGLVLMCLFAPASVRQQH